MNRFRGKGLYLLDEPEAALSPMRQIAMIARIHELVKQQSQFIIATHSPIIMAYPNAQIYLIDAKGTKPVKYVDTEHFLISRNFLNRYETYIRELTD